MDKLYFSSHFFNPETAFLLIIIATGFDFKLDVTGNKGILNLDMVHQGVAVYGPNGGHYAYMAEPLLAEDQSFVDAVLDNTDVPVTGHDGLVATRMVLAALESIESKSTVRL